MTANPVDYTSNSQQRILKTLLALRGVEDTGLAPSELAKRVNTTPSNTTRDLFNLKQAGLAEQIPGVNGRWRLSPGIVQIATAHMQCRDRAESRLQDLNRFTRTQ